MDILVLKLILTPALIGMVSLVERRWGPTVSGRLIGLPLTSGPVALLLALDHGNAFAAEASKGIMLGPVSVALFCVGYGRLAPRFSWPLSLMVGLLAFTAGTALLRVIDMPLLVAYALVIAALAAGLELQPRLPAPSRGAAAIPPRWDLPARMALATVFVLLLTGFATALGPRLSGLLAPLPIFASILAVFTHRINGAAPVIGLLRGVLYGAFSFATFFLAVTALIQGAGIPIAFAAAIAAALVVQAISLQVVNRNKPKPKPREVSTTRRV